MPTRAWPHPTAEQLNRLSRLEGMVQGWLHGRARAVGQRGAAVVPRHRAAPSGWTRPRWRPRASASTACARRASAKAHAWSTVLVDKLQRLRELAAAAEPMVPAVVQRQQQRFLERWTEALAASGAAQTVSADSLKERALNEAAAYAIRIDVAEELARLRAHLDEIERLLHKGGEVGKRLDFLIQELQREANTLGSKSAALELTQVSVEMKVLIEQMREQVQNIE